MRSHRHKFDWRDGLCSGCGLHRNEYLEILEEEVRELETENRKLRSERDRLLGKVQGMREGRTLLEPKEGT